VPGDAVGVIRHPRKDHSSCEGMLPARECEAAVAGADRGQRHLAHADGADAGRFDEHDRQGAPVPHRSMRANDAAAIQRAVQCAVQPRTIMIWRNDLSFTSPFRSAMTRG